MKSTKLRKKIKIRGVSWQVRSVLNLTDEFGEQCAGLCDNILKTIFIEEDLQPHEFLETLIHEYIHACLYESGVDDAGLDHVTEHWIISSIAKEFVMSASFWAQFFRR